MSVYTCFMYSKNCIVTSVKQDNSLSHTAQAPLKTYLTHAKDHSYMLHIWKQAIMPSGGTRLFQLEIGM